MTSSAVAQGSQSNSMRMRLRLEGRAFSKIDGFGAMSLKSEFVKKV